MMSKYVSLVQLQLLLYPNIQISQYANMHICKYAKYANMFLLCKTAAVAVSPPLLLRIGICSRPGGLARIKDDQM